MATVRRKFTNDQKLEILQEAQKIGVIAALRTHSLSYSVFARWRQQFVKPDPNAPPNNTGSRIRSELKQLTEENSRLKKIIASQALELERKDEDLRKNNVFIKR
jgi:putative transposase